MRSAIVAVLIAAAGFGGVVTHPAPTVPACVQEDGSTQQVCHWDAQRQGNGQGVSFTSYDYGTRVVYD